MEFLICGVTVAIFLFLMTLIAVPLYMTFKTKK